MRVVDRLHLIAVLLYKQNSSLAWEGWCDEKSCTVLFSAENESAQELGELQRELGLSVFLSRIA